MSLRLAGLPRRECTCSPGAIERYRLRLSGPLLDRIDLQVYVQPVPLHELRAIEPGEPSATIRERVIAARDRQRAPNSRSFPPTISRGSPRSPICAS